METLSKSEFAAARGVTPGRVSQWISEGKIGPDALAGEGRAARVIVDVANAQLDERLDPSQRYGLNGLKDKQADPADPPVPRDDKQEQILAEKLRQAQMMSRKMAREEAAAAERYVLADQARAMIGEALTKQMQAIEGGLADMAMQVAAATGTDQRQVTHALRKAFRDVRARAAATFREVAEDEAETTDDVVSDPAPAGLA